MSDYKHRVDIYGDGIGYVALVAVLGNEFTPAGDARMSTGKGQLGPEKDAALQARLIVDRHTSPFEGVVAKFELCVPLFVLRELDRHRTLTKTGDLEVEVPEEAGRKWFSRNEMSGRYVQLPPSYYFPIEVRAQSKTNKQAGVDLVDERIQSAFLEEGKRVVEAARKLYDWGVEQGIEKGLARIFNTQNQYTRIRLTGSLKNWLDFLSLRLAEGVVLHECRMVALAVEQILGAEFPSVLRTWRERVYDAVVISGEEVEALRQFFLVHEDDGEEVNGNLLSALESVREKVK